MRNAGERPLQTLWLAVTLIAGGCGQDTGSGPAVQAAARVNGEEITVHQVRQALPATTGTAGRAIEQTVEALVDQTLLVQAAVAGKLDRTPGVMRTLDAARREILARAYVESVVASAPAPEGAEVEAFYASRPELFSARRIYSLEELAVAPREGLDADIVRQRLERAKSAADLLPWLRAQAVPFRFTVADRSPEELSGTVLADLSRAAIGATSVTRTDSGLLALRLVAIRPAPLTLEQARSAIEQHLLNEARARRAREQLAMLRSAARIEYPQQAPAPADAAARADR